MYWLSTRTATLTSLTLDFSTSWLAGSSAALQGMACLSATSQQQRDPCGCCSQGCTEMGGDCVRVGQQSGPRVGLGHLLRHERSTGSTSGLGVGNVSHQGEEGAVAGGAGSGGGRGGEGKGSAPGPAEPGAAVRGSPGIGGSGAIGHFSTDVPVQHLDRARGSAGIATELRALAVPIPPLLLRTGPLTTPDPEERAQPGRLAPVVTQPSRGGDGAP
jgi:hypothetical protein